VVASVRLYLRLVAISLRAQMAYRASFLMFSLGQLLATVVDFVGLWALFQRFEQIQGWRLPETAILYGLVNVGFALAEAFGRGFDTFDALVRHGEFDRVLLRPAGTVVQIAGRDLQLSRIGRGLQGMVVLVWGIWELGVPLTAGRLILLAAILAGTMAMFCGLFVLQATLAFWTVDSLEIMNTMTYGGVETAQYPLDAYQSWFRRLFTFVVPLGLVVYLPAKVFLGHTLSGWEGVFPVVVLPMAGLLFLVASLAVWRFGVRHYQSTGS
jgi:ABC-2 type transport system permease protein